MDERTLKKLQVKCAEEVKRINGTIKFEEAYNYQREKLNKKTVFRLRRYVKIVKSACGLKSFAI